MLSEIARITFRSVYELPEEQPNSRVAATWHNSLFRGANAAVTRLETVHTQFREAMHAHLVAGPDKNSFVSLCIPLTRACQWVWKATYRYGRGGFIEISGEDGLRSGAASLKDDFPAFSQSKNQSTIS